MTHYVTYFGTAINKRPKQLVGRLSQMFKSQVFPCVPIDFDARYENQIPEVLTTNRSPIHDNTRSLREAVSNPQHYKYQAEKTLNGTLSFLNDPVEFLGGAEIKYNSLKITDQPIHWRIKCYGFEHIKWVWLGYESPTEVPDEAVLTHQCWLDEWIAGHEIARERDYLRRDWTPHAVSLRICNWCRYEVWMANRLPPDFRQSIRQFIWKNAAFLSNNVEHGVGGNHLIENAVALLIAGVYFSNDLWIHQSKQILRQAADIQLLSDGGHFERSPMYHLIVCQRFLTATDLLNNIDESNNDINTGAVETVSFLEKLSPPDKRIPLLNDSVFDEALSLSECLDYAAAVLERSGKRQISTDSTTSMPETGYYWLGEGEDRMLVVAGKLTVSHLPAHVHAHPAQICLWLSGMRVVTDTGVYEYSAGERRSQSRSVRNHNTIQVDQGEPLRFAGEFLCWGSVDPHVEYSVADDVTQITIDYTADAIGNPTYHHERCIVHRDEEWSVQDHVEGVTQTAVNRLHIHPDFTASVENDQVKVRDDNCDLVFLIDSYGCDSVSKSHSLYFPQYGREINREVIEFRRDRDGEFGMSISVRGKARTYDVEN